MKLFRAAVFTFILSVLIISLLSCEDGGNPANPVITGDTSKLQLISFSPDTVSYDSTITIIGKNFLKDTVLEVKIGDSTATFKVISDDSIIVNLPHLSEGGYTIEIISKTGKQAFQKLLYKIVAQFWDILNDAKSFSYSVNKFHIIEQIESSFISYPNINSHSLGYDTTFDFNFSYNSKKNLGMKRLTNDSIQILEFKGNDLYFYSYILLKIDDKANIFENILIHFNNGYMAPFNLIGLESFDLNLINVPYIITNKGEIVININNTELNNFITQFQHKKSYSGGFGHNYASGDDFIKELLPSTDSTSISITISK